MLESDHLLRAEKLRALLAFFVEEWITFGDRPISQQRLAEEVLGQPREADGIPNAQARIYLWRLRKRIAAYYAEAGGKKAVGKKTARRKVKPAALVLTSELTATGVDGDLKLLPTLVPRALTRHLLGQDGIVAIGPVPREQLSDRPCESPVAPTSAAEMVAARLAATILAAKG